IYTRADEVKRKIGMKYIVGFLLISISAAGVLHGMESLRSGKIKQNNMLHSYYFYHVVVALERRDQERVELYCNLDKKLVFEVEKAIAQNVEQTKWAMDVMSGIKARARL